MRDALDIHRKLRPGPSHPRLPCAPLTAAHSNSEALPPWSHCRSRSTGNSIGCILSRWLPSYTLTSCGMGRARPPTHIYLWPNGRRCSVPRGPNWWQTSKPSHAMLVHLSTIGGCTEVAQSFSAFLPRPVGRLGVSTQPHSTATV